MNYILHFIKKIIEFLYFRKEVSKAKKISSYLSEPLSRQQLDQLKKKLIGNILLSAISNSNYYSDCENNINDFPLVDKLTCRNYCNDFTNSHFSKYKKFSFSTGGSTGEPFVFEVTRLCGFMDRYHSMHFYQNIGYKKNDKIFSFDGINIEEKLISKNIYWKRTRYEELPYGSVHFSAVHLSEETFIYYFNKLKKEKPSFIRSYPSTLVQFVNYMIINNLNFPYKLKGVVLSSETILDYQMSFLKNNLKCPIYGQYGHSEMCVFAYSLPNSLKYLCSPYYGLVEILDDNGNTVKEGEIGQIVVTNYFNEAMYFIRYETGDLAEFGGYNEDGFLILNRIIGREQDFVYDFNKRKINITSLVFGSHFNSFKNIKKWQIKQIVPGEVEFIIIKMKDFSDNDEKELFEHFHKQGIKSSFIYVDTIPLTSRGKHKLVIHEN